MNQSPDKVPASGSARPRVFNTQVNVLFQSEKFELPNPETFKAFTPEAQKAILSALEKEQAARHAWMEKQQANEHQFNMMSGRYFFWWKMAGTIGGFFLALGAIGAGCYLIKSGCSYAGVGVIFTAVAALVGTAIWGQKQAKTEQQSEQTDETP